MLCDGGDRAWNKTPILISRFFKFYIFLLIIILMIKFINKNQVVLKIINIKKQYIATSTVQ